MLAEGRPGTGTRSQRPNFHSWMRKQQPEQLSACITCGTCYRDPNNHPHEYAITAISCTRAGLRSLAERRRESAIRLTGHRKRSTVALIAQPER